MERRTIDIAGCEIEYHEAGEGRPLLFLHPGGGFRPDDPYVAMLSEKRRLICPSHPGFGRSALPDWIDSVDDIAHIHLELLDKLKISELDMMGSSIGGWTAAEMATMAPERFKRIVLVAPVGVKTGPADTLDIPDIFVMAPPEVPKLMFHDAAKMAPDFSKMSDEDMSIMLRNRESLALYVWEPYMHNPKLPHRLQRVSAPVLFVRGASDGLVGAEYIERYARLVPNGQIITIGEAGHAPHLEQPEAFVEAVETFLAA